VNQFLKDIEAFHIKYGLAYNGQPRMLDEKTSSFRAGFIEEELDEYILADTMEDKFDALIDLVYVALGTAYLHGFDFEEGWKRVQAANMKKVRATQADQSKRGSTSDVVKPEGWEAPDLRDLVYGEDHDLHT
jgi:predicted HAD superfamily Cof-like phosphohydrolase